MSPSGTPKIRGPKMGARPLEGAERCPECEVLQDWSDQFMTIGVGEDIVRMWTCHACGHTYRTWKDEVLESGEWPVKVNGVYIKKIVRWTKSIDGVNITG